MLVLSKFTRPTSTRRSTPLSRVALLPGRPRWGGKFAAGRGYISGKYIELERGKRILHEWTTTEWPKGYPPSMVELILKPKGKKTELTMIHSKVPAEQAAAYDQGWKDYYWVPLRKYFEKRLG
jgi:activator of HSP90 ATPase